MPAIPICGPEQGHPGEILREAVQHDQAHAANGRGQGEQHLVAPVAERDEDEVRPEHHGDVRDRQPKGPGIELVGHRDVGESEPQRDEDQQRDEEPELGAAPGDAHRLSAPAACGHVPR